MNRPGQSLNFRPTHSFAINAYVYSRDKHSALRFKLELAFGALETFHQQRA